MKYIIFTFEGNGFPLAHHLQLEGCDVIVGQVENIQNILTKNEKGVEIIETELEKKQRLSRYNNILNKLPADYLLQKMRDIKNPEEYLVFFDFNNLFRYADPIKELGFHGNFPTEQDRLFEIDRDAAKDFVKRNYPKLKITKKHHFRSIIQAKEFLKKTKHVWVLKGQNDFAQTFVPHTDNPRQAKQQIIETLNAFQKYYETSGFFFEEKIPNLIELTPEKIYYDGVPLGLTIAFEHKFIGSGNIGFQVLGCAQDLVFPISLDSKIHDIAFPPIVDKLAKQHKGLFIWDASLLINGKTGDMYFGEFCSNRPGYNTFFTTLATMPSRKYFFENIIKLKSPFIAESVGASVMAFNLLRDLQTNAIVSDLLVSFPKKFAMDIWPFDIYKKSKNDVYRTTGYDIHIAPITGSGKTIQEAVDTVYKHAESFVMNGVYYRPKFDFLSKDYSTSLLNRLDYGLKRKLFEINFEY